MLGRSILDMHLSIVQTYAYGHPIYPFEHTIARPLAGHTACLKSYHITGSDQGIGLFLHHSQLDDH